MQKNLAVLLLRMEGSPDMPTLDYATQLFTAAGRGTGNLLDYYDEMSHGRLDLSGSRVYDWINYGHTKQDILDEWAKAKREKKQELLNAKVEEATAEQQSGEYANAVSRGKIVEWARDAAAQNGITIATDDVIICVFNQSADYFGSPGRAVLNWNAADLGCFSVDLTGVAHEVGHALGLNHSRMDGSAAEYGDKWDIMSAYNVRHFDQSGGPVPPGSTYFTYGPGLNAVNMELAGWLDQSRVFNISSGSKTYHTQLHLRPLHRRDLPGWLAAKLMIGSRPIYLEFRMDAGWDMAFAAPCILLHQESIHPQDGQPCSEVLVAQPNALRGARADLRAGETFEIGNVLDIFGHYATITVREINRETQEAWVDIYVRAPQVYEGPSGIPFGGVIEGGGGLVFVPGRGFVPVPPHSPLIRVMAHLADVVTLQTVNRGERGPVIDQLSLSSLISARDTLSDMIASRQAPKVPSVYQLSEETGSTG
ncbi:conserved protein of unknown function [Candidatus Promineifilum breve]|uniref:Uncharacterized protein n=2 Tax=Candidatus Promineifilum breve TaxID=1806508 RepID=A0A170PEM1_9CHLR|nr:conserved protein of unknown function [Candidatus Promineifilum breve]